MTALIVVSAIILILAFFLNVKIRAEISFLDGVLNFSVKYLCFTIFPFKEKKKKNKEKHKKKKSNEVSDAINEGSDNAVQTYTSEKSAEFGSDELKENRKKEKKNKESITERISKILDILEKVKIIWSVSKKWLVHIFKHIYIEELMVDCIVSDEDAYKAAMNYGKINAAIYNSINLIRMFFTVTIKTVDIVCDFDNKNSRYDFSAKITVRPATILSAVFGILFGLLINIKKLIGKNNKQPSAESAVSM